MVCTSVVLVSNFSNCLVFVANFNCHFVLSLFLTQSKRFATLIFVSKESKQIFSETISVWMDEDFKNLTVC